MKWKYIKGRWTCFVLLVAGLSTAHAQNNPIFKGGTGDGYTSQRYVQNTSNIFIGGNGDGWSAGRYVQPTSNIFTGGNGDGWSVKNYVQVTSNIFTGGTGDGWSTANHISYTSNIFTGGNGDGWTSLNYAQSSVNVYTGGAGDGWASSYLPQQPLPVMFLYFTAQKQGDNAAIVQWKTGPETNTAYFDIERSTDAVNFEKVGKVTAAGSPIGMNYSFTDNHPAKGTNYYRLKQVDKDNIFSYTPSRMLRFDDEGAGKVRYYPNPTNGILNIEITKQMQSEAIVVNISNANGAVLNQMKISLAPSSIISVSMKRYPKGIYFVQVKTQSTNSVQRIVLE
ncbi:MAG: Peptidase and in kexin sedolisin [Segetibacter sp.]|nr:Peptidase and in kexin sedolisin [Segetibacter sp.]